MIRCLHFVVFLLIFPLFSTLCSFFLYFVLCSSTYSPGFGNFSSTFFLYFIFYTLECIFLYFSVYFLPDLAEFSLFCCFPARCRYHDIISQSYCFCLFYFPVIYLCDDFKADGTCSVPTLLPPPVPPVPVPLVSPVPVPVPLPVSVPVPEFCLRICEK